MNFMSLKVCLQHHRDAAAARCVASHSLRSHGGAGCRRRKMLRRLQQRQASQNTQLESCACRKVRSGSAPFSRFFSASDARLFQHDNLRLSLVRVHMLQTLLHNCIHACTCYTSYRVLTNVWTMQIWATYRSTTSASCACMKKASS